MIGVRRGAPFPLLIRSGFPRLTTCEHHLSPCRLPFRFPTPSNDSPFFMSRVLVHLRADAMPSISVSSVSFTLCCRRLVRPFVVLVRPVSERSLDWFHASFSFPPFPLGTASGEFLRPAASCLLLFRFLPKKLREQLRSFFVPLPKCRPSPWEQSPLAFECPNYKGRKWRNEVMYVYVKWNSFQCGVARQRLKPLKHVTRLAGHSRNGGLRRRRRRA